MALVSMRQLLDHAAENGYGEPVEGRSGACARCAQVRPPQRAWARIERWQFRHCVG